MASVQCHRTCEERCQQKVSDVFKGHHNNNPNLALQSQNKSYGQTQMVSNKTGQCATATAKTTTTTTQTEYRYSQTQTTAQNTAATTTTGKCHGNGNSNGRSRNRGGEHKRNNLFQKIKDGLSGHSSDSSSSDSESDNENCRNRRKNCN